VTTAFVGLGANLGDRVATLASAVRAIDGLTRTRVLDASSVHESEPWGVEDQPAFANAVVSVDTTMTAREFLDALKGIERSLGRIPGPRYGPRAIDLDLLLFGDEIHDTAALAVPHPRLLERDFVVTPLLEIAPDAALPDGRPVSRAHACAGRVTGRLGPLEWSAPRS
jgi:2-amino-4-hydroxy-6-hydroxymethyldihydropteridine diphosphokinase